MSNDSPSAPRRHRRGIPRSVAACQRCRRRKQKCDGKLPTCGPCHAAEATCIMSDRLVVHQGNTNCECNALRAQLAAAEQRGNQLAQQCERLQNRLIEAISSHRPTEPGIPTPGPSSAAQTTAETVARSDHLDVNPDCRFTSRILRPTFSVLPNSRQLNRSAMSSAWELWGDDTDVETPSARGLDLNHDAYTNLVDAFFDKRWAYLPVLHRKTFIHQHLMPFLTKSEMKPTSTFLVNIVCAIASAENPAHQTSGKVHRLFFNEATKDLYSVISAESFECVQCLLLLCMYGHNEPQSVNMWYTTGVALNLVIGMDLHRKESLAGLDMLNAEMCKRVFWCAYVMNCSMSINMGRPLGIQECDISMPLPLQLTDAQLNDSLQMVNVEENLIPQVTDMSTFIHIIKLRRINAAVYRKFHSVGSTLTDPTELNRLRNGYFVELNQWLVSAPRYMQTSSTFQSTEWFQIAFNHAILSLYRPSRAVPMPSSDDLRICTESAIGLISSYSALYARNRIKYTFVAIHSLFMAAVTMLYSLRAFGALRRELTKPVVQTNILTFLTLFRGVSDGRPVGEKCCGIVERLGQSILSLFENEDQTDTTIDTEFQTWFGLQTHKFPTDFSEDGLDAPPHGPMPDLSDVHIDLPWTDLFTEGIDVGSTDVWSVLF